MPVRRSSSEKRRGPRPDSACGRGRGGACADNATAGGIRDMGELFDTLMSHTGTAVVVLDENGRFVQMNTLFSELSGYDADEMLGRPFLDIIEGPFKAMMTENWSKRIRGEDSPSSYRLQFRRKDGEVRHAEVTVGRVSNTRRVIASARDITDEVRLQETLAQSEEKYRVLAEQLPVGIFIHSDGKAVYINSAMSSMVGYSIEELGRIGFPSITHPDDFAKMVDMFEQIRSGRLNECRTNFRLYGKSQRLLNLDLTFRGTTFQGRPAIMGTAVDVTANRELEDRLRQSERISLTGSFAAGLGHEINNPLQNIFLLAQNIRRQAQDERVHAKLDELQNQAKRIEDIVSKFLKFSRRVVLQKTDFDASAMISQTVMEFSNRHGIEGVVSLVLPHGPLSIRADRVQIQAMLENLLENALDAQNKPDRKIEVRVSEVAGRPLLNIRVRDNGRGIPREDMPRVFDPFFTTKEVGSGMGLGLSLCHGIVQAHDGSIDIRSSMGEGAEVIIYLPTR